MMKALKSMASSQAMMQNRQGPTDPILLNPRRTNSSAGRASWYPYYAGYSLAFAEAAIRRAALPSGAIVLDPWLGSGTTIVAAASQGVSAVGFDLNPVAVLVARARCIPARDSTLLATLASMIGTHAKHVSASLPGEPLEAWFSPASASVLRSIDASIQSLLLRPVGYEAIYSRGVTTLPAAATLFYLALFRTVRSLLKEFGTSNPTWVKRPQRVRNVLRPKRAKIHSAFAEETQKLIQSIDSWTGNAPDEGVGIKIAVADSRSLPLRDDCVDLVLTSPPYCTRIDYAVSTSPELAVLGVGEANVREIREAMLGTTVVAQASDEKCLPESARRLISLIGKHQSKASSGYYRKTFAQYFTGLRRSIAEVARVLKPGGVCIVVVQDSYYKDVHVDLPAIVTGIAREYGMSAIAEEVHSKGVMPTRSANVAGRVGRRFSEAVLTMAKDKA